MVVAVIEINCSGIWFCILRRDICRLELLLFIKWNRIIYETQAFKNQMRYKNERGNKGSGEGT